MSEKEALLPTKRIFCNQCSSEERKCVEPPDHLRSEITSRRALATFQNIGKARKQETI